MVSSSKDPHEAPMANVLSLRVLRKPKTTCISLVHRFRYLVLSTVPWSVSKKAHDVLIFWRLFVYSKVVREGVLGIDVRGVVSAAQVYDSTYIPCISGNSLVFASALLIICRRIQFMEEMDAEFASDQRSTYIGARFTHGPGHWCRWRYEVRARCWSFSHLGQYDM